MFTDEDVVKSLRQAIRGQGSQTKLAKKIPCAVGIVNDILKGRRRPTHPRLLKFLGYEYKKSLVKVSVPVATGAKKKPRVSP